MNIARAEFVALPLHDTAIIVFGGFTGDSCTKTIERYSIKNNTWTIVGCLNTARRKHTVVPIGDDRFVVVGGIGRAAGPTNSAELYDMKTQKTREIAKYPISVANAVGVVTSLGTPVIFGGNTSEDYNYNTVEGSELIYTYSVDQNAWVKLGEFPSKRMITSYTTLRDGRVVVTTGSPLIVSGTDVPEIILETNNTFTVIGTLPYGRFHGSIAELDDGIVMVMGGMGPGGVTLNTVTTVDVSTGRTRSGASILAGRMYGNAISFEYTDNGVEYKSILLSGGSARYDYGGKNENIEMLLRGACDESLGERDLLSDIEVVESAFRIGTSVRLTDNVNTRRGALLTPVRHNVRDGFSTDFSFEISKGSDGNRPDGSDPGGLGIAFIIQTNWPPVTATKMRGIGYDGIRNCLAIEFDTYRDSADNDPNGSHCAVQGKLYDTCRSLHKSPYLIGMTTDIPELKADGAPYYARVICIPGRLSVFLSRSPSFGEPILTIENFNIEEYLPLKSNPFAAIGFTAATWNATEQHDITSWSIVGCPQPPTDVLESQGIQSDAMATISPMPTVDVATLIMSGFKGKVHITVCSCTGAVVTTFVSDAQELSDGLTLNAIGLVSGVYIVHLTDGTSSRSTIWSLHH
ncbi:MAG: hypothetical protein JSS89_00020 [Bacteroidetes bacterium]|nr:hypothetical protein [Bacteroidota bacterium]